MVGGYLQRFAVASLFWRLDRILKIHVHRLVADIRRYVGNDFPVQAWGKQPIRLRKILSQVSRVIHLALAQLPSLTQLCRKTVIEASEFEVPHVIDGVFF